MDKEHLSLLEKKLNIACHQFISRGGTLIKGRYRTDNPLECCPVRASIVLHRAPERGWFDQFVDWVCRLLGKPLLPLLLSPDIIYDTYETALSQAVGFPISHPEVMALTLGFDSHIAYSMPENKDNQELFLLGRRLSEKYRPVAMP
jgi:hypothetical protein